MTQGHNQSCTELELLFDDYLHGELPRPAAEQLAAHLESCADCRFALDDLRVSAKLVGAAFEPIEDPGLSFARMVMARIDVADHGIQGQKSFWRPFEALAWRLAFSAALVLAFLFAYGIQINSEVPATPSAVSIQQRDIIAVPVSTATSNGDEILMAAAEHRHE